MEPVDNRLDIFPHPDYGERAEHFCRAYNLVRLVGIGDVAYSKRALKGYTGRTCLFCGRSYPDVSLTRTAMILPNSDHLPLGAVTDLR